MRTLLLVVVLAPVVAAQSPGDPLTLIRVIRKHLSPRSPIDPYVRARSPVEILGLRSLTGSAQAWLVEAHGSFASLENLDNATARQATSGEAEDELVAPTVSMIGVYRHGLSYRPDEAVRLMPSARFVQVAIYRSRPGYDIDFAELIRLRKAALDNINSDRPELGYQIVSGASTGTYLFLVPLATLRILDDGAARWAQYRDAGGGAGGKAGRQISAEADVTREHLLFRVEPRWCWSPEKASQ